MANPQNEALVHRVLDLLSQPQLPPDFDQIIDPSWENHAPIQLPRGHQGFKGLHDFWHQGFSDFKMTMEKMVSDGDYVADHFRIRGTHTKDFMGIPPTGKSFDIAGTGIHRFRNGKLIESWVTPDRLEMFRQLGVKQIPETPQMPQQRAA